MNSTWNWQQTAQTNLTIPSTFGMPACGNAFSSTTSGVRADEVRIKGHLGLAARAYVPGTNAWSPPIS
jgi:hypothetical protein